MFFHEVGHGLKSGWFWWSIAPSKQPTLESGAPHFVFISFSPLVSTWKEEISSISRRMSKFQHHSNCWKDSFGKMRKCEKRRPVYTIHDVKEGLVNRKADNCIIWTRTNGAAESLRNAREQWYRPKGKGIIRTSFKTALPLPVDTGNDRRKTLKKKQGTRIGQNKWFGIPIWSP